MASLSVEAISQGTIYRGTSDGKIFISTDSGRSWQLHTNFGAEFLISDLATDAWGQIHAQLKFAGHSFELELAQNGKAWRAV
jgi:hypothetical protein